MFKEIIELGERLEFEGKLVPTGFYKYSDSSPIKWVVHILGKSPLKCYLEETAIQKPRPKSGRTKRTDLAHPIADEAGYVFGVDRKKDGIDIDANKKHVAFMSLLDKMNRDKEIDDEELKEAIPIIKEVLSQDILKSDARFNKIMNKDWVSFIIESGTLSGKHLFEHPDIKAFWAKELQENSQKTKNRAYEIEGECSICGKLRQLLKRIPGVKLYKPIPLHSYNEDAFVSFMDGTEVSKKSHIGQCFVCGDAIARTLNYLTSNELHYKIIAQDRKDGKLNTDSARNQFALFWLKDEQPLKAGETTLDPAELLKNLGLVMSKADSTEKDTPQPDLMQLENMLNIPWAGRDASINIANNAFYLLVLSPNKGRIAVRDWIHISLDKLQQNLKTFLDAQRIIDPAGKEKKCFGIPDILKAIEASNISKPPFKAIEIANPNISRQLLRTAYLGEPPPSALLEAAVMCMRNMKIFGKPDTQHVVMATLKMFLTHRKEGMKEMETRDTNRNTPGYLCGMLLSILEEAQLRAARWKINTTLVDRFYGSASSAPVSVFGTLISRATTDHFPKIRKQQLGYKDLEALMESVQSTIDQTGGYPKTLSLEGQAEFSLGFYHQRAKFCEGRTTNK
ncbi:MAG TPA: type I-C CRISPR-associated protein Cas8c/Csd1 [Syntrophales bacterium]|nr:type I-C CRISPR-associated protein Cas8c/Csd1 [Syntrophorhabdus sp.]HPX80934.1 type I-C CRISPR-associated protein Cas8c/Csd1 [Syntrophales bacterium]HQB13336.1 type I-C CRISPR-associated protein Cas8c/Csd1 [Syntrophales bacterium]